MEVKHSYDLVNEFARKYEKLWQSRFHRCLIVVIIFSTVS